jgi:oxygen-independent coproporphyrinogen-3 oxidase
MAHPISDASAHSDWDIELIRKYDVAGPRYTSYPTANLFDDTFTATDYLELAGEQTHNISPLSLYVHVPFCRNICYYCACNKIVTKKHSLVRQYLDAMAREMEIRGELHRHRPVTQLHLGGGTPTYLKEAELTELMHLIGTHFRLSTSNSREYSIEIDPRTVKPSTIALLKGLGFNRISMGIQDFDPLVQQSINRTQSPAMVAELVQSVRDHDFKSLSFDLIYGLPNQSVGSFKHTIDRVIDMGPDRIALYNYAHLPQLFTNQRAIDRQTLPSADTKLAILEYVGQRLLDAGYDYIGMDHFVRPGDELEQARHRNKLQRNFQGYSTSLAVDLVGMGPSSISQFANSFSQNAKGLDEWADSLARGKLPIIRGLRMNSEDQLRKHVIMELACQLQINIPEIEQRFGIDFAEHFKPNIENLQVFARDGLLEISPHSIVVTTRGRLLLRNICMSFDEYLEASNVDSPGRFSRTI